MAPPVAGHENQKEGSSAPPIDDAEAFFWFQFCDR
jgi:hypothetical protein